ncbi:MAG: DUF1501 domain-containing protein [Pirellulales bacterium]|nr:DUF1501 domain-containing protein [Pirellulales bacterium]
MPHTQALPHPLPNRPLTRRDLLRVGALGVAASASAGLKAAAGVPPGVEPAPAGATAQSVILLWMAGGVTHIDSFDPKPEAPEEIRGTLSPIATRLAGVYFAETAPRLAALADRFALVRSFSHPNNDHLQSQAWTLSGRQVTAERITSEPNLGSVVAHLFGLREGLPGYIAVPGITRPGPPPYNLFVGGWLGNHLAPFALGGEPEEPDFTAHPERWENPNALAEEDLRPKALHWLSGLDLERLVQRSQLRQTLERAVRRLEATHLKRGVDPHYDEAFRLLCNPRVRDAFDLAAEPDALKDQYGRTKIGGRCMMARRLIEAGARFVMVDYGYDPDYGNLWDNHAVPIQRQPHICEMARRGYHVAGIDQAFAALLLDLEARGLLETTLVVYLTEFGRTPRINADGGRDHWGPAGSIFFAGGGVQAGQVIGATDRLGAYPTGPGYTPSDVAATICRAIGLDPHQRLYDREGRPQFVLPEGQPIPGLLA